MIDSDVSQQTFNVFNIGNVLCKIMIPRDTTILINQLSQYDRYLGNTMVELLIKTPKNLSDHVSIHPKSTTVDPKSSCKINVRLIPESNIITSSKRYE